MRFIEYMDVGGATQWSLEKVFTRAEMLEQLTKRYGTITPLNENSSAPAERFRLPDGTVFGIIASTTTPFCRNCDRSRLTADGLWYLCLYAQAGIDLRKMLRGGRFGGRTGRAHFFDLARANRSRRGVARRHRPARRTRRDRAATAGSTPRNAYARGLSGAGFSLWVFAGARTNPTG